VSDLYDLKNGPGPLKATKNETASAREGQSKGGGAKVQDLRRTERLQASRYLFFCD